MGISVHCLTLQTGILIMVANVFFLQSNNNNNKHDNVYGAVIMAEPLQEFTRLI